jgi:phosphatidate cytidylyltransferase
MHLKRWITGIVALPIIYLLVSAGGMVFALLIAAVSVVTLWEYYRAVFQADGDVPLRLMPLLGLCLSPVIVWTVYQRGMIHVPLIIAVDLILVAGLTLPLFKNDSQAPHLVAKQVLGLVYIPLFLSFLTLIRSAESGAGWIFLLLLIVAAGDTGAFYSGTYLGRHKLCPWVSPKKTIEGSLGGLAANIIVALVFKTFLLPSLSVLPCIVFAWLSVLPGRWGICSHPNLNDRPASRIPGRCFPATGDFSTGWMPFYLPRRLPIC